MAQWSPASRTHVSHMRGGDFYHGEKSMTLSHACEVRMDLVTKSGKTIVLRPTVSLLEGEVIDSMFMSKKALCTFFEKEMEHAQEARPAVLAARQGDDDEGVAPDRVRPRGAGVLQGRVREARQAVRRARRQRRTTASPTCWRRSRPCRRRSARRSRPTSRPARRSARACRWSTRPRASPTCTAPNDVIVDASMPAMIRAGGMMWGPDGKLNDDQGGDARVAPTRASTRRSSTSARPTAPSTRRPWARCRTSA